MKKLLLILLCLPMIGFGQKEAKIYYDKDWKVTKKRKADYYRILLVDENNQPYNGEQEFKDYYKSGQIQSTALISYLDPKDSKNDVTYGDGTWYYKNGQISMKYFKNKNQSIDKVRTGYYETGEKSYEELYDENYPKQEFIRKDFFKNGNLLREGSAIINHSTKENYAIGEWNEYSEAGELIMNYNYENKKLEGDFIRYYTDGKTIQKYTKGMPDPFTYSYPNSEKPTKYFVENFSTKYNTEYNPYKWSWSESCEYSKDGGLDINKGSFAQISLPVDEEKNFKIEFIINSLTGNEYYSIYYGLKNSENYYSWNIAEGNGAFNITFFKNGLTSNLTEIDQIIKFIDKSAYNKFTIIREDNELIFAINSNIVYKTLPHKFFGNIIGLQLHNQGKKINLQNLRVVNDIEGVKSSKNSKSEKINSKNRYSELQEIKRLLDIGILSQEEYKIERNRILNE